MPVLPFPTTFTLYTLSWFASTGLSKSRGTILTTPLWLMVKSPLSTPPDDVESDQVTPVAPEIIGVPDV